MEEPIARLQPPRAEAIRTKTVRKIAAGHHLSPSANHKSPSVISGAIAAMLRSTNVVSLN